MISPGLDGYYVPASRISRPETQNFGEAIGQAIQSVFYEVPTRVLAVSPNVDINWVYGRERLSFVAGVKIGLAVALNGTNSDNESLQGKLYPDLGLYVGTRF
jgi:hypothetical protein